MSDFESLWYYATHRGVDPIVQNKEELEKVYDTISGCKSYLEVGSAEGTSLYVLAHALNNPITVSYVDFGEHHTEKPRKEVVDILYKKGINVHQILGSSHLNANIKEAKCFAPYDVVLMDAGHLYEDVLADAMAYGQMASKYIIFHDIVLKDVLKAFLWYVEEQNYKKVEIFKTKDSDFGFGIITL